MVAMSTRSPLSPSADRVVAREIEQRETRGGIVLPATAKDATSKNTLRRLEILAVGPGAIHAQDGHEPRRLTCQEIAGVPLEVGSVVLAARYLGTFRWQDATGQWLEYVVIGASEILGAEA
jgi:co-chaperonin GroES (HSP10)